MATPNAAPAAPVSFETRAAPPGRSRGPASAAPVLDRGSVPARIRFDHLGERAAAVRYEVAGPAGAPAVAVLGGISAGRHVAPSPARPEPGWWPGLAGAGLALDPTRRRIVGLEYLGGASEAGLLRPVTTRDQARALARALDALGLGAISLVGASYGGMVALAFAELFPDRVDRLVVLCAAHRSHPMATAVRSVQRAVADLGVRRGDAARGLSLARALAMTTYRSAAEFEGRFSMRPRLERADPGAQAPVARFPVEDYLDARGAAFARAFDADRFLALSESIDLHRTDPGSLPAQALLVSIDSDVLVPPWLVEELAAGRGRRPARHVELASPFGHDGFLKEVAEVSAQVAAGLADGEGAR